MRASRYLVVDRSEAFARAAVRFLTSAGATVVATASEPNRAHAVIGSTRPQIAIIEWRHDDAALPELVAALRAAVPEVVVAAAFDWDPPLPLPGTAIGVDTVLRKSRIYEDLLTLTFLPQSA